MENTACPQSPLVIVPAVPRMGIWRGVNVSVCIQDGLASSVREKRGENNSLAMLAFVSCMCVHT